ncbi:MAG: alpha-1,4-glucan--maltose-1-phosphate maltosyltransferase [Desulfobacterales bacterium]
MIDIQTETFLPRVIIERVSPEIDGGRFPVKRTLGEKLAVSADIFTDGHDLISGVLMHRPKDGVQWEETPLRLLLNDRWYAAFSIEEIGGYVYTLCAWIDEFKTWRRDLAKKTAAGQDVEIDLLTGAALIEKTADPAPKSDGDWLRSRASDIRSDKPQKGRIALALGKGLLHLMQKHTDRKKASFYEKELLVLAERKRALYGSWYEMFPRSCAGEERRHGTFDDCEKRLPYIADMGFDILYLPPIHPIGRTHRKGKNNTPVAGPEDPGSPWAIGVREGGHTEIHPLLGTLADFRNLVKKAEEYGIEIAMDLAFQCSPDHPYVSEHPEWFRHRPDGSIQYAENPPKKYEDIYPLDFESDRWRELARELMRVTFYWIEQGIRIFRVDNPHTKPFAFWEWLIGNVRSRYPETIFLSEAFTRPKVMYRLAKAGFSQSYTYFTWRNTAYDIQKYFTELTRTEVRDYFRPNLWPNTPDILTEYLQTGGRAAFIVRLVLAATLGASYGIYGPAFELCMNEPKEPGSEEYLDSEKYETKTWDISSPMSLKELIARVNHIRKENPALHNNRSLAFLPVDNEQMICYSKRSDDRSNTILVVVNLDPHHTHAGWVDLPLSAMHLDPAKSFQMHDLLSDARFLWYGDRNYVELDPRIIPAHIFAIRRKVRTEKDFDYYL